MWIGYRVSQRTWIGFGWFGVLIWFLWQIIRFSFWAVVILPINVLVWSFLLMWRERRNPRYWVLVGVVLAFILITWSVSGSRN